MKCRQCGTENNAGAKFCRACGAQIKQVQAAPKSTFCPSCGTQNNEGSMFCKNCGAQLKAAGNNQGRRPVNGFGAAAAGINKMKGVADGAGGKLAEMFKKTFTDPAGIIRKCGSEPGYGKMTLLIALIGNLIIAMIPAIYVGGDNTLGIAFVLWITLAIIETMIIVLMFAAAKLFRSSCSLGSMFGAFGPVTILSMISIVLMMLMTATESLAVMAIVILFVYVFWGLVLQWMTFRETARLSDTRFVYAYLTAIALIAIVLCLVVMVMGAIAESIFEEMIENTIGEIIGAMDIL